MEVESWVEVVVLAAAAEAAAAHLAEAEEAEEDPEDFHQAGQEAHLAVAAAEIADPLVVALVVRQEWADFMQVP
jgi:hypothetical protein